MFIIKEIHSLLLFATTKASYNPFRRFKLSDQCLYYSQEKRMRDYKQSVYSNIHPALSLVLC